MIDITQIVVALVGLLAAIITYALVPWAKAKVGAARWAQLMEVAKVSVLAAEQLGATDAIADKLGYATVRVRTYLADKKITFDDDAVRAAIEAAVIQYTK